MSRNYGPTRGRNPQRLAETKVGKGVFDKMIADGGKFQGSDARTYELPLEEVMPAMNAPIPIDPGVAILEEIARSHGYIRWLEQKIVSLDEAELVRADHLIDEERSGGPGGGYRLQRRENRPEVSPWWLLYERERKHYATVCAAAVRVGIEERKIRLAERQADMLEAAFLAAIAELGLDPNNGRVRQAIGKQLRLAIEGEVAVPGGPPMKSADPVPVPRQLPSGPAPVDF